MATAEPAPLPAAAPYLFHRHALAVRVTHWINAIAIIVLLGTGLNIFNAHPSLYWGQAGSNDQTETRWLQIGSHGANGYLRIGGVEVTTTGVLGVSQNPDGSARAIAYPGWATIPTTYSLADGRRWHFLFAWVLAISLTLYMLWSLLGGHLKRDLHVRRAEWSLRHIWRDVKDHARLRFPNGEAAARYHILQKLSYIGVIFVLLPLMIATGLTMSPGLNASAPWLLDLFGGRQSARSIHFLAAWALVAFFVVHLAMVLLAGPVNEVRSMITGWFRLSPPPASNSGDSA